MLSFPCHQIRLIIFCCCPRRYKSCDHRHFIFCAGFNATITKLQIDTFTQKNIEYFSTYRVQFSHGITATHCYSSLWILLKHRNCSFKSLHQKTCRLKKVMKDSAVNFHINMSYFYQKRFFLIILNDKQVSSNLRWLRSAYF